MHLTPVQFVSLGKSLSFAVLYSLSCPEVLAKVQEELSALQGEVRQKEIKCFRLQIHPFLNSPLYITLPSEPKMQLRVVLDLKCTKDY